MEIVAALSIVWGIIGFVYGIAQWKRSQQDNLVRERAYGLMLDSINRAQAVILNTLTTVDDSESELVMELESTITELERTKDGYFHPSLPVDTGGLCER